MSREGRPIYRWRVFYQDRDSYLRGERELKFRELAAPTAPVEWVFTEGSGVQAQYPGESEAGLVLGFPVSVWSGEAWVDPAQLGLGWPEFGESRQDGVS